MLQDYALVHWHVESVLLRIERPATGQLLKEQLTSVAEHLRNGTAEDGWPNRSVGEPLRLLFPIMRARGAHARIVFQNSRENA